MFNRTRTVAGTTVLAFAGALALAACDQEGPAEQVGESIDESAEDVGEALEEAGDAAEDAVE